MIIDDGTSENGFFALTETVFTVLSTGEMVLKITGLGFIFGKDAYIRDAWNVLDFVIVTSSLLAYIDTQGEVEVNIYEPTLEETSANFDLTSLRTFRVARPLKTISSVKGLKVIIVAVLSALPLLQDTMLILLFFFVVFGILGQ